MCNLILLQLSLIIFISNLIVSKQYNDMKTIILIFIIHISCSFISAQEKRYTNSFENGYVWISLSQPSNTLSDYKHDYLASLLENQRIKKMSGIKPAPVLNCDEDLNTLVESKQSIDLDVVIKMMDQFYYREENLILPILGAYCYCIKSLTDINVETPEEYRKELLDFSGNKSEQ